MPIEGREQFEPFKEELGIAPAESDQSLQTGTEEPKIERLIEPEKLRYIEKVSGIMRRHEEGPEGEEINRRELYKQVKPWENGLELSDNIREVVRDFVAQKIPVLKEIYPLSELPDKELLNALANGWFEEIGEQVEGQRREVLLAVAAHIAKRIETDVYKKVFENASPEDLEKLGLDNDLKDLAIKVLDTSMKANPLFVRFMAYSYLSGEPPEQAEPTTLFLPTDEQGHTIVEMFPHETQFLAKRFAGIASDSEKWINKPGADIFKKYLEALGQLYQETDQEKAAARQEEIQNLYGELISSDFPILITPATEGYYKEPYLDPELKISLATPEAKKEEDSFKQAQKAMAESLKELGVSQFAQSMREQDIRSTVVIGGYGVNLTFNAVAQEKPAILMYLNEQIRAYDNNFPELMGVIQNTDFEFNKLNDDERKNLMEKMSRMNTMLHEFSHSIYPDESKEAERLGRKPLTVIDEVKADISYRPLIPLIIEKGGLEGTKEQWAAGMITSSLQMLKDHSEGDEYYYAAVYTLNDLFEQRIVDFENNKIVIKDFDAFYQNQKQSAQEVISLFENSDMTEKKAGKWVEKKCTPDEKLERVIMFIKGERDVEKKR